MCDTEDRVVVFEIIATCILSENDGYQLEISQTGHAPVYQILGALESAKVFVIDLAKER